MSTQTQSLAGDYVNSVNRHDAAAYIGLFSEDAVVDDGGRIFQGRDAIRDWAKTDIFDVNVSLDVLAESREESDTVITTKVDGTFDRTGLPDPVIIMHRIDFQGGKIARLTCRLADDRPTI